MPRLSLAAPIQSAQPSLHYCVCGTHGAAIPIATCLTPAIPRGYYFCCNHHLVSRGLRVGSLLKGAMHPLFSPCADAHHKGGHGGRGAHSAEDQAEAQRWAIAGMVFILLGGAVGGSTPTARSANVVGSTMFNAWHWRACCMRIGQKALNHACAP